MKQIQGLWWPDDIGEKWRYSVDHVRAVDWACRRAAERGRCRTAVQAGGNMGLWPLRLAKCFLRVITFEPDAASAACLLMNVAGHPRIDVRGEALGIVPGHCGIHHRSVGSHQVVAGRDVEVTTIDALGLEDLDFLQLDVEGYEWHAVAGASDTLARCRPLIQLELRDFTRKYGHSDEEVVARLAALGYRRVSKQGPADVVFEVSR